MAMLDDVGDGDIVMDKEVPVPLMTDRDPTRGNFGDIERALDTIDDDGNDNDDEKRINMTTILG